MHRSGARGVTAKILYQKSNREVVDTYVRDQIRLIDAAITTAHANGFSQIDHELPVNFAINNLDKEDAQIMVYSEIIDLYKKPESEGGKGFTQTFIEFSANKTILSIHWLNGMNAEERARRRDIILGSRKGINVNMKK